MKKSTKIFIGVAIAIVLITVLVFAFLKTKTSTTSGTETGDLTSSIDTSKPNITPKSPLYAVAEAVIRGEYGDMPERKQLLEAAGYNYEEVQTIVNRLLAEE